MILNALTAPLDWRPVDRSPKPDGLELAISHYESARCAERQRRHQAAVTDVAALTRKLTELNISPILAGAPKADDWDEPFDVEADGTVTVLIAHPTWSHGGSTAVRRYVWACARQGWLWLRASHRIGEGPGGFVGEAGPLDTLADVGRAVLDGPITMPVPATGDHADEALQVADRDLDPKASVDAREICTSLSGLTHAVLALAEQVTEQLDAGSGALSGDLAELATAAETAITAGARPRWRRR
ncbi:hypothetical protein [Actinomadura macrotermitis]|uniref:Uncharacterized protein n=1 Tax=Actinomadura macrotermitis TaxID=2585200 RepID=A0A7K0C1K8_9ACTN|nr:hypothetical protein [Actinomadura macrotermitis]MQY07246.1 hypothetical protein [Actinomadura macrotermitis]